MGKDEFSVKIFLKRSRIKTEVLDARIAFNVIPHWTGKGLP